MAGGRDGRRRFRVVDGECRGEREERSGERTEYEIRRLRYIYLRDATSIPGIRDFLILISFKGLSEVIFFTFSL